MKKWVKLVVQILVYYVTPPALLLLSIFVGDGHFFKEVGNWALNVLIGVMFIKPLYVLIPWKFLRYLGTYRREAGVLTFWLFLFHAIGLIYSRQLFDLSAYFVFDRYLFWGAVAGLMLVILGLTSNNISVRTLKGNWKRVQYLAYPAFVFTLIHAGLAHRGGEELWSKLGIAGLYVVLKGAQIWKEKRAAKLESVPGKDGT